MLRFMYGRAPGASVDFHLDDLFRLSLRFEVQSLQQYCENFLMTNVKTDNAIHYLRLANDHVCDNNVKDFLTKYCVRHIGNISKTLGWRCTMKNKPCHPLLMTLLDEIIESKTTES